MEAMTDTYFFELQDKQMQEGEFWKNFYANRIKTIAEMVITGLFF